METIEELRARTKALLSQKAVKQVEFKPNRSCRYFHVITPVGYEWCDTIHNLYFDEKPETDWSGDPDITVILHGHTRNGWCFAPTLCHVLEYTPVGNEPQWFKNEWKKFNRE